MNFSLFFRMRIALFLTCIALSLAPTGAQAVATRSGQVTRVMLFWLKRPGNVDDQNFLLRALRTLRRARGVNDMRVALFLTCIALSLAPTGAQAVATRSGQVTRVMLFWLKRPGNVDDQNFLRRALRTLRRARGVNDMRVGRPLLVDRPSVEQSFDLGVVMTFRDREALEKFERDQRRQQAIDAMLRPLVRQYIVYNFVNE